MRTSVHRSRTGARRGLVRVRFELEADAWHGYGSERLWAEPVAENRYRLRNSPFYAYGISTEDVVFAKPDASAGLLFEGVSLRGGHSTYRILSKQGLEEVAFRAPWERLQVLGCTYEQASPHLLSVDVPPHADIYAVYALLERGENAGVWDFEEGHCGHPLRE
jgi:hypothetical protein